MKTTAVILALFAALVAPAQALRLDNNPGGMVRKFETRFARAAARGERVTVSRGCFSACTLVLGLVPRSRICAEPGAVFGFHSASYGPGGPYSHEGTVEMWRRFPPDVRAALFARGWQGPSPHPQLVIVPATQFVRPCGGRHAV